MRSVPVLALLLVAVSCSRTPEVRVFAAASLSSALEEIAHDYEKSAHEHVVFNFGASSTLARQIEHGAPADLFLSADEAKMNHLAARGLIDAATRRSALSNTLVVVVPLRGGSDVRSAMHLAQLPSLALADPATVPAGIYAREWLTGRGVWNDVASRVIPTDNVRSALAAVEAGNAAAAIVYRTDAMVSRRVRIAFEVPRAESPQISYPFAIVAGAEQPRSAARFLAWLQSPSARAVFAKHGFLLR